jgi:hypothetical protein
MFDEEEEIVDFSALPTGDEVPLQGQRLAVGDGAQPPNVKPPSDPSSPDDA